MKLLYVIHTYCWCGLKILVYSYEWIISYHEEAFEIARLVRNEIV